MIYLAAPLKTPEHQAICAAVESMCAEFGVALFSPRLEGEAVEPAKMAAMTEEERRTVGERIFISNIEGMERCQLMLAFIDVRDVGVAFEMGYTYRMWRHANRKDPFSRIIGVTLPETEAAASRNLMITVPTDFLLRGMNEVRAFLVKCAEIGDGFSTVDLLSSLEEDQTFLGARATADE